MSLNQIRLCGWALARLGVWMYLLLVPLAVAQAAPPTPCPQNAEPLLPVDFPLAEFRIQPDGSVSRRHTKVEYRGSLELSGEQGDRYWVLVERVPLLEKNKNQWCAEVPANGMLRLPMEHMKETDFLRVSVVGQYKEKRDKASIAAMRKRELTEGRLAEVERQWMQQALLLLGEHKPEELFAANGALLPPGDSLKGTLEAFEKESCSALDRSEIRGFCAAGRGLREVLSMAALEERRKAYDQLFKGLPRITPESKKMFCQEALTVERIEQMESSTHVLLSVNELPVSKPGDTYTLRFGEPKRVIDLAPVGEPVVTWLLDVPVNSSYDVTWKVNGANRTSSLEPLIRLITFVAQAALRDGDGLMKSAGRMETRVICDSKDLDIKEPVLASRGSRVHVAEPLLGHEVYDLKACLGKECTDKAPEKELAQAEVHTRAESWRMTLSLGFNLHARMLNDGPDRKSHPFQSWRWRPVGSTTGSEQIYQYSRVEDPLAHASASVLLTFLSPSYIGSGQVGVAFGPSLLVGTELQPLRQWTVHGVLAFKQGFHLTVGGGVRFEDVPVQPEREGELQLVARGADDKLPDLDQRRVPTAVLNVGFALDMGLLAEGGEELLKLLGFKK
ncbi:hypothetical protein [Vitiosangium sp. GDMCC 1.1324]|uniref:hypothetical protein n=1 Tax=Vitiosangium sp. (strain GDMCC 1.1324) TaxID=2138576 RepID=UPI000D33B06C|nr:hypothetical protein [Vitiosangium sp. GDMCC 1.1324]PTL79658.1 hypothetical protein DAT35_33165 [Vitiosangium sp. GDMCC 1.1324]